MKKFTKSAFTLAEIIVTITILAILATIAFTAYTAFGKKTRDAARIGNLMSLEKSLESQKSAGGEYPIPENAMEIEYEGKVLWRQGILGQMVRKKLEYEGEILEPKYQVDYTYSVSADGKVYQFGTILEDEKNAPSGWLIDQVSADDTNIAYTIGNYKGKFFSTRIGSEIHIITIPSFILTDPSDYEFEINIPTTRFTLSGEDALPEAYQQFSSSTGTFEFTPRVLYQGPNCGVSSDQEIINFVANLRDSYNMEPFLSMPNFQEIFDDYEYINSNAYDFTGLETIGKKINKALGCNIQNFETIEVFPISCGIENGTFELMRNNFELTQSCLFTVSGNGASLVKDGEGKDASKGLLMKTSGGGYQSHSMNYRIFSYVPTKLNFDYKATFPHAGNGDIAFYIDGIRYDYYTSSSTGITSYQTYTSPLLPEGIHDFTWTVNGGYYGDIQFFVDNILASCVGGGGLCGWSDDILLNTGPIDPWDIVSFAGLSTLPWPQTTDKTEGTHAIYNPYMGGGYKNMDVVKTINFASSQKINFDYKATFPHAGNGDIAFYIDGIRYDYYTSSSTGITSYQTYTSPLLPSGDHTFTWRVNGGYYGDITLYLDNINFSCVGGGGTCGRSNDILLNTGAIDPWDIVSFAGLSTLPWPQTTDKTEGTHAIYNPYMGGGYKNMDVVKTINFASSQKINFDYKATFPHAGNGDIAFYIDGIRYDYYTSSSTGITSYQTYTSPLLPSGDHTFTWRVNGGYYGDVTLYLDNIRMTCVGGGGTCGWSNDILLNTGPTNPWDIVSFAGLSTLPWPQTTDKTEGTHAIYNPYMGGGYKNMDIVKTITFATFQKINFSYKATFPHAGNGDIEFYIDGIRYDYYTSSSTGITSYQTYTSPLLPSGDHTFTWRVNGGYYGDVIFYLDNIRKTN